MHDSYSDSYTGYHVVGCIDNFQYSNNQPQHDLLSVKFIEEEAPPPPLPVRDVMTTVICVYYL